jgi:magnesium-transporting ATPase (P-type)
MGSSSYAGLNMQDRKAREKYYGNNKKKEIEREGFWNMWWGALDDLMLKILIVAAFVQMIISLIFEEENKAVAWIEGGAILLAVFTVSIVTAWNDYKKEE